MNFKKLAIIVVLGTLVFLGVFGYSKIKRERSEASLPQVFTVQSDSQAGVTVEVTPEKLGADKKENIFAVKLETHTVDLDFDFEKIMVLADDLGNNYQALKWEGERGGHHLEGEIVFPKIRKNAKMVTLKIFQVGSQERTFSWEL